MTNKLKIGILGCASIAERYFIPAIIRSPKFALGCIASRDIFKAKKWASIYKCGWACDYSALIESSDIDAVYIPLPSGLHYEWILKAIRNGKHVYAEKSFALSRCESSHLVSEAEDAGIGLMEGYMFLYHSQQTMARGLVESGKIGEIRHFSGAFGFPPLEPCNFRYDEILSGGVLADAAGYPLRAATYFLGDNLKLVASFIHRDHVRNTSLWGSAFLTSQDPITVSIAFSFSSFYQCRYEIWGSDGKLILPRAYTSPPDAPASIILEANDGLKYIDVPPCNHFVNALEEFHGIILSPLQRKIHYNDILVQSRLLGDIASYANR